MWQYEDRRPSEEAVYGINRLWQQHWLTTHTATESGAIYIGENLLNNQVMLQKWRVEEGSGADMKKKRKQSSFWQHKKWAWAVSLHLTGAPLHCRNVTSVCLWAGCLLQAVVITHRQQVDERWLDGHMLTHFYVMVAKRIWKNDIVPLWQVENLCLSHVNNSFTFW